MVTNRKHTFIVGDLIETHSDSVQLVTPDGIVQNHGMYQVLKFKKGHWYFCGRRFKYVTLTLLNLQTDRIEMRVLSALMYRRIPLPKSPIELAILGVLPKHYEKFTQS